MSFTEEEIGEFKAEALELLDIVETSLLGLDNGGDFSAVYDAVFRSFHNLKGASGMMELEKLQHHMHELENILMPFKEKTSMSKNYISFFLRGVDGARSILDGKEIEFQFTVEEEGSDESVPNNTLNKAIELAPELSASHDETTTQIAAQAETSNANLAEPLTVSGSAVATSAVGGTQGGVSQSALDEFIAELDETSDRVEKHLRRIESGQYSKENLDDVYRDVHSLKGASYLFGYPALGDLSHAMESSLEPVREGTHRPSQLLIDSLYKATECIEIEVEYMRSGIVNDQLGILVPALSQALMNAASQLEPIASENSSMSKNESVKVDQPQISSIEAAPAAVAAEVSRGAVAEFSVAAHPPTSDHGKEKDTEAAGSIRVPVALLDNLMTLMGEMVLVRNQVIQFSSNSEDLEFLNLSKRLNSVTSEIQGEMMKTRMQQIGNILTKFHRVVRDLSKDLKKEITLTLSGAETELDKSLLEAIKDPLTHIIRNSCDHGIETPEVRRKAGKPEGGTIGVKSYHEGGQVVIEIVDDGKGLHKEVLLKKALEKGLITQAQASNMNEKEIYGLIFAPGFSTAAAITNVSGRGVGMDVVRTNIERIGGTVELNSFAGRGTTTKIKIPLTLAIVPALIVRSGQGKFAIPQVKLEELVRVDQSSADNKIEFLHGAPVYRLRGNILPLVNLNKILGDEPSGAELKPVNNIAVLNADQCAFGLIVDEVQDTADIVVKPLNRLLKSLLVYSGATILGDGSIALILDVMGISKVAEIAGDKSKAEENAARAAGERRAAELQEFLVVRVQSSAKHALVLGYVHRLEEFKRSELEYSGKQKVIRYGKSILPVVSVSEELGYDRSESEITKETLPVVVIQKAGKLFGLEVDEIVDTLSTDADTDTALVKQKGIYGNLNTPEELIVIVDPFELIASAFPDLAVKAVVNSSSSFADSSQVATGVDHFEVGSTKNILLVEDTVFFRRAITAELEKQGHVVTGVCDGREALDLLEKNRSKFDLIVSDIEMPRMNGFDLAKAVRANHGLRHLPMLAISSKADKKYIDRGVQAGFDLYLEKLNPEVLANAVTQLTQARRRTA